MSVRRAADGSPGSPILLEGVCPVEDAEPLAALLLAEPGTAVDWSACTRLHTAVYQVLLRTQPPLRGACGDAFVARWLVSIQAGSR